MKSLHGRYYDWKSMIAANPIIGRLQITDKWRKNKWGNVLISCICTCGNVKEKLFGDLNKTKTDRVSCGCLAKGNSIEEWKG